jgi:hypothetical protein
MSFVCAPCLEAKYQPVGCSWPRSSGPCEDCGKQALCYDVPSPALRLKPARKPERKPYAPPQIRKLEPTPELEALFADARAGGDDRWWCSCDRGHAADEECCDACEMKRPKRRA